MGGWFVGGVVFKSKADTSLDLGWTVQFPALDPWFVYLLDIMNILSMRKVQKLSKIRWKMCCDSADAILERGLKQTY